MASANVIELTEQNWQQEVVETDKPVLVDVWAPWCAPCRALTPTMEKLANDFQGKVKVGKLNMDEAPNICIRHRVSSIPAFMIFNGGEEPVMKTVGMQSEAEFVKMLNRVLEA
jgi:thioredoxin 1